MMSCWSDNEHRAMMCISVAAHASPRVRETLGGYPRAAPCPSEVSSVSRATRSIFISHRKGLNNMVLSLYKSILLKGEQVDKGALEWTVQIEKVQKTGEY